MDIISYDIHFHEFLNLGPMGKTFVTGICVPVILMLSFGQYSGALLSFSEKATDGSDFGHPTNDARVPATQTSTIRADFPEIDSPPDSFQIEDFNPRNLLDSLSSYHRDSLLEVWYLYLTLIDSMRANTSPYKQRDLHKTPSDKTSDFSVEKEKQVQKSEVNLVSEKPDTSSLPAKEEKRKGQVSLHSKTDSVGAGYVFFVQIGASRTPLEPAELNKRYNGPEKPRVRETEVWYKYQIGKTDNYIDAYLTLRSVNTPDAFIVVYDRAGNKLKLWKAILAQRRNIPDFRVQVAASRVKLSEGRLSGIYSGNQKVRAITEEGWYKYQIDAGTTLHEARKTVKETGVEDAFPVVYLKGRKMNLSELVRIFNLQK